MRRHQDRPRHRLLLSYLLRVTLLSAVLLTAPAMAPAHAAAPPADRVGAITVKPACALFTATEAVALLGTPLDRPPIVNEPASCLYLGTPDIRLGPSSSAHRQVEVGASLLKAGLGLGCGPSGATRLPDPGLGDESCAYAHGEAVVVGIEALFRRGADTIRLRASATTSKDRTRNLALARRAFLTAAGRLPAAPPPTATPVPTASATAAPPVVLPAPPDSAVEAASLQGDSVTPLSRSVATANDVGWELRAVVLNALLALLLVVLMPFPAALFNGTLEANYDRIRRRLRGLLPLTALPAEPSEVAPASAATGPPGPPVPERRRNPLRGLLAVLGLTVAVSLLNLLMDPDVGLDGAAVVLLVGLVVTSLLVTTLSLLPAVLHLRRRPDPETPRGVQVALFPLGLAVAALCVLLTRLASFAPGYLYGVIAGVAVAATLSTRVSGRLALASAAVLLLASGAAFLLRSSLHDWVADNGDSALPQVVDTALAGVAAGGIDANVIGLLPIAFMSGARLLAWSRIGWGVLYGLSVFGFLQALSGVAGEAGTTPAVRPAVTLFLVFGTFSVLFWAWFRFRPAPGSPSSPAPLEA
jgi:hypothetical protein